jgi:hypothetical protein
MGQSIDKVESMRCALCRANPGTLPKGSEMPKGQHIATDNAFIKSARYKDMMELADLMDKAKFASPLQIRGWVYMLRTIAHTQYRATPEVRTYKKRGPYKKHTKRESVEIDGPADKRKIKQFKPVFPKRAAK